jgi:hypothetical protein
MPNSADAGVVDFILSPDKMTEKLLEVLKLLFLQVLIKIYPWETKKYSDKLMQYFVSVKELISLLQTNHYSQKNSS